MEIYYIILSSITCLSILTMIIFPLVVYYKYIKHKEPEKEESNIIDIDSMDFSTNQLKFVDMTIMACLQIFLSDNISLNKKLNIIHIDEDIKSLSMLVFNSLKPDFFESNSSVYKKDFLYQYIIKKCKVTLIDYAKKSNNE